MKKRTSIIAIIIAILVLGVGYAAVSTVTLTFGASGQNAGSTATIDSDYFDVIFDVVGNMTSSPANSATFTRTDDHTVTFDVTGLKKRGDSVVVTIPFKNDTDTLKAQMADASITYTNHEYFEVTATSLSSVKLNEKGQSGDSANLVITVTALKTPVSAAETTTITGSITATPTNS